MELKTFFIIFEKGFGLAKIKHSNSNFKTGLCYMYINNTYITLANELYILQFVWTNSHSIGYVTLVYVFFVT